jgi:hypothetical protein
VSKVAVKAKEEAGGEAKKGKQRYVCPRCGEEGYLEVRRTKHNDYYFCVHDEWVEGRRVSRRRCYLGAARYKEVEPLNPLGLTGLFDRERFKRYAIELLDNLEVEDLRWLLYEVRKRLGEEGEGQSGGLQLRPASFEELKKLEGEEVALLVEGKVYRVYDHVDGDYEVAVEFDAKGTGLAYAHIPSRIIRGFSTSLKPAHQAEGARDEGSPRSNFSDPNEALKSLRASVRSLVEHFSQRRGVRVRVRTLNGAVLEGRLFRADEHLLSVEYEVDGKRAISNLPWASIEVVELA